MLENNDITITVDIFKSQSTRRTTMMIDGERNINMLFEQMGMDSDDAAVEQFIQENQLPQSLQSQVSHFHQLAYYRDSQNNHPARAAPDASR